MTDTSAQGKMLSRNEPLFACLIIIGFLLINLFTCARVPTVYVDEVMYVDPAAGLYFGDGFTSTMWGQGAHEFYCGNVPLYPGALFCFFKLFGFGLLQARMFCAVLAAAGGGLIWLGLRRAALIESARFRLLTLLLVFSGSVSVMTFRMARYDALMFFVCSAAFFAATLPKYWRASAVLLACALLPAAGIAMLPYGCVLAFLYVVAYRGRNFDLPAGIVGGLVAGVAGLYVFYQHFGAWNDFVQIILPFTGVGGHAQHRSLKTLLLGSKLGDESALTSFFGNPTQFLDNKTLFDYSAFFLFVIFVVIAIKTWRNADASQKRLTVFILLLTLLTPPLMHVAGHYRSFYRWMTYIPLTIAASRMMEIASAQNLRPVLRRMAMGLVCLSLFMGIPLRTLVAVPGWRGRSVAPMDRAAAAVVKHSDVVVYSYKAYFSIRRRARLSYALDLPARGEFDLIKDFPADQVSLLCVMPEDTQKVKDLAGAKWELVPIEAADAASLARSRYNVLFYRRASEKR